MATAAHSRTSLLNVQEHRREWNAAAGRSPRSKRSCVPGVPMSWDCYSGMQTGMRNSESFEPRSDSAVTGPIGWEMRVHRRVERLERALRLSSPATHVIRISFVDRDGKVSGTMVASNDPSLRQPYRETEGYERQPSED
jgi:hypothetical protein